MSVSREIPDQIHRDHTRNRIKHLGEIKKPKERQARTRKASLRVCKLKCNLRCRVLLHLDVPCFVDGFRIKTEEEWMGWAKRRQEKLEGEERWETVLKK